LTLFILIVYDIGLSTIKLECCYLLNIKLKNYNFKYEIWLIFIKKITILNTIYG